MYVVLIETSGNQNYIFATNKLRENVGASELTYQVGTKYVLSAIGRGDLVKDDLDGSKLREFLLSDQKPFTDKDGHKIEVIVATSGKALLLVNDEAKARKIVSDVTTAALRDTPGLTVHGAIEAVEGDLADIHVAVAKVHRRLENLRYRIPSNQQRFQRLPWVEPCATSGLPASEIYQHDSLIGKDEELRPHSSLSIAKQKNSKRGRDRLERTLQAVAPNVELMDNINELEKRFKQTSWIAIVHADGNGIGEIFLNFQNYLGIELNDGERGFKTITDARLYLESLRNFSVALEICTVNAAGFAVNKFQMAYRADYKAKTGIDTIETPIIPLILGGDDLTVICDGEYAVSFVHRFLTEFERQTARADIQGGIVPSIAKAAFGVPRLGICAGIAITKPHYPFHQAYYLAEQLLKSAKQVKTVLIFQPNGKTVSLPCSAMDFHILYDSSGVELNQVREKLIVSEKDRSETYLFAKPYVVTNLKEKPLESKWVTPRTWNNLANRVSAMRATESDDKTKRKLPNSQLHLIRESLYRGQRETDSEIDLFEHRYSSNDPNKDKGFGQLLCEKTIKADDSIVKKTLFFREKHKKDGVELDGYTTHFLDALDAVEFWKGFDCDTTAKSTQLSEKGDAE